MSQEVPQVQKNETKLSWKRKVGLAVGSVAMTVAGIGAAMHSANAENVTCDPNNDNGCVVDTPEGTLPTLPDKEATTTTLIVTSTTSPNTSTTITVPKTTTTTSPETPPTVPETVPEVPETPETPQNPEIPVPTAPPAVPTPVKTS